MNNSITGKDKLGHLRLLKMGIILFCVVYYLANNK